MKYLITESQELILIEKFLDMYLQKLGPITREDFFDGDMIVYFTPDEEFVIAIHVKKKFVEIKRVIWEPVQNSFGLEPSVTKKYIWFWLSKLSGVERGPWKISLIG